MRTMVTQGFPGGDSGKEATCQQRRSKRLGFDPWVGKIPWRRKWQSTPVFLPGESHGQKSLVGCSPWGGKELDMTEHETNESNTHTHASHSVCPWAPLSVGLSRQEYWSGLPFPSPGNFPDPGMESMSPDWQADS